MEHQRCYIYEPSEVEERPSKRQRIANLYPYAQQSERLEVYRNLWAQQSRRIQETLEQADSAIQGKIVNFISTSHTSGDDARSTIPTALIVAGPSIASHGPFFERLGRKVKQDSDSAYVVLTAGECPNLKTLLKSLIKKATSRVEDDDEDDGHRATTTSRHGPKLLNFDLDHIREWRKKNRVTNIVVAIQDSEAFETNLLADVVDLLHSWLDRIPFVLLFGIATSAESFEDRLSGKSLRYLQGQKFDVTLSDDIIEKLFHATVANTDNRLHVGPTICRRMLDRQKDHVQNTQDFCDGLKYAHMSHFYANCASIFLKENLAFEDVSTDAFECVRNLPSFRRLVETLVESGHVEDVRSLLDSSHYLFARVLQHIEAGQKSLSGLSQAAHVLASIRQALQMLPTVRSSSVWVRASSGELNGSPLLRETMLTIKKLSSDKFSQLLAVMQPSKDIQVSINLDAIKQELNSLIESNEGTEPLRTQHDVRNDSLRTTVVAQKVLLSKHRAALSEQDKAYSDLVSRFHDELESYFDASFVDPQTLVLAEILIYDLKSPHIEVFQPKPRFAIERALSSSHDYLGCDCCSGVAGNEAALNSTQPATAIVYQMYLESGTLINANDLWSAFNAIVGETEEENEAQTMALFQRALAELKYLGLVKPSRKKTDHIAKVMWKGL
ncbi:Origin recognition complex subunit 3 [Coniothyrium glycines]